MRTNANKGKPSPHRGKGRGLAFLKANVNYEGEDCLIWPQSKNHQGYGQLGYFGKVKKAHHIMCLLVHGPAPTPKHEAAHNCGKGHLGCVHPKHVEWKTPAENQADTIKHGTRPKRVARRLTIDQVEEIKASELSCVDLAARYPVSISTIFKIRRGEIWANPRSKLTSEHIRSIKNAPLNEALALGKSLGLYRHRVLKLRAGEVFGGVE